MKTKGKPVTETSHLDASPNFVEICAIMTKLAVKVSFKMAAAAILDFAESEFLQQNRLWDTVF